MIVNKCPKGASIENESLVSPLQQVKTSIPTLKFLYRARALIL